MQSDKSKSIYFLVPYPTGIAPGQRFRFEHFLSFLTEKGFKVDFGYFYTISTLDILYKDGYFILKVLGILYGFISRTIHTVKAVRYSYVFIFRELTPVGPPIFEWIIAKVLNKKIIYDFDDAIWLEDNEEKDSLLAKLKWKRKVSSICEWSYKITVGNDFLREYASQFNNNVVVIPTVVDTEGVHNPRLYKKNIRRRPVIGWTGTHSTLQYLKLIKPVLQKLEKQIDFEFLVISNKNPDLPIKSLKYIEWAKETEIKDLLKLDVGIMPLTNDPWSKGKCGFKALQYMSLEIPAVVSPVGVNSDIVDHKENGLIADTLGDWEEYLIMLMNNKELRAELGKKARAKVIKSYSVTSCKDLFLALFS